MDTLGGEMDSLGYQSGQGGNLEWALLSHHSHAEPVGRLGSHSAVPMTACSWQQPEFVFPYLCSFSHLTKSQQLVLWRPRSWSKVLCELVDKQIKVKWYPARVVPGVLSALSHTDLQVHLALGCWLEGATRTNAVWKVSVAQILLFLFVLRTRRKAIWGDWGVLLVFMCFPAPCNIRLGWQVPI